MGQLESHLYSGGYVTAKHSDLVYCKRADGIVYSIDGESYGSAWAKTEHGEKSLLALGAVLACDKPSRPIYPDRLIDAEIEERARAADNEQIRRDVGAPSISTNARRAGNIAPNGYRFPDGEQLGAHLREGGHIMINGRGKWYRMRANLLECLHGKSSEWESSAYDNHIDDLVRNERVVACSEPELSKEIRMRDQVIADTGCARPRIYPGIPKQTQEQPAPNLWQPISFAEAMHAITLGATATRIGELPVHIYASINGEHVVRRVARGAWARVILNVDMIQAKWKVINQFDKDYLDSSISAEWDGK
jgi:hypothetical protein